MNKIKQKILVMIRLIVLSLMALSLVGCVSNPIIIKDVKTVFIEPAVDIVKNCEIEPPPNKEFYLTLSQEKKEAVLAELNRKNYKNLGDCNTKLTGLRKWISEQKKIYLTPENK